MVLSAERLPILQEADRAMAAVDHAYGSLPEGLRLPFVELPSTFQMLAVCFGKPECWDSFAPEPPIRAYTEEDIRLVFERMRSVVRPEISSTGGSAIFDAKYAEALAKCRAQRK